jgi:hypothetical protein
MPMAAAGLVHSPCGRDPSVFYSSALRSGAGLDARQLALLPQDIAKAFPQGAQSSTHHRRPRTASAMSTPVSLAHRRTHPHPRSQPTPAGAARLRPHQLRPSGSSAGLRSERSPGLQGERPPSPRGLLLSFGSAQAEVGELDPWDASPVRPLTPGRPNLNLPADGGGLHVKLPEMTSPTATPHHRPTSQELRRSGTPNGRRRLAPMPSPLGAVSPPRRTRSQQMRSQQMKTPPPERTPWHDIWKSLSAVEASVRRVDQLTANLYKGSELEP